MSMRRLGPAEVAKIKVQHEHDMRRLVSTLTEPLEKPKLNRNKRRLLAKVMEKVERKRK